MDISKAINPSTEEITCFGCELLELGHGIRTIRSLYQDELTVSIGEIQNVRNLSDPRFVKAQKKYNSLQDRVTKWTKPEDTRFANIFYRMIFSSSSSSSYLQTEKIENLIGKQNTIDTACFKKFGIICLKDHAIPDPKPQNVVTEAELKQMLFLREKIKSRSLFNKIKIEGSKEFKEKTLKYFEKILTYSEGRELIIRLYQSKRPILIFEGEASGVRFPKNNSKYELSLSDKMHEYIGVEEGKQTFARKSRWISLAHELIHIVHHIEDPVEKKKRNDTSSGIHELWGNKEEYETIGNPKKIPQISENAFILKTFFPLRKFHAGRNINEPLSKQIRTALTMGADWSVKLILEQTPPITPKDLKLIAAQIFVKNKHHTLKALLNHPHFKEIQTEKLVNECRARILSNGWSDLLQCF